MFVFFLFQNVQAQIYLSEGTSLYSEKEAVVSPTDTLVANAAKNIIYISSGVNFSNLNSDNNYEIVEDLPSEIKKAAPKKQSVLHLAKAQAIEKIKKQLAANDEDSTYDKHIFSQSTSEVYFSFAGGFSKVTVPVSNFSAKQLLTPESYKVSLAFVETKLTSEHFKNAELLTAQNEAAFSVRPPPFFG